jgi:hypothetical protein
MLEDAAQSLDEFGLAHPIDLGNVEPAIGHGDSLPVSVSLSNYCRANNTKLYTIYFLYPDS